MCFLAYLREQQGADNICIWISKTILKKNVFTFTICNQQNIKHQSHRTVPYWQHCTLYTWPYAVLFHLNLFFVFSFAVSVLSLLCLFERMVVYVETEVFDELLHIYWADIVNFLTFFMIKNLFGPFVIRNTQVFRLKIWKKSTIVMLLNQNIFLNFV